MRRTEHQTYCLTQGIDSHTDFQIYSLPEDSVFSRTSSAATAHARDPKESLIAGYQIYYQSDGQTCPLNTTSTLTRRPVHSLRLFSFIDSPMWSKQHAKNGYHCIFQVFVCPKRNSPLPGVPTGALYSNSALKLSGSHLFAWLFLASLAPTLLAGAERVPLTLTTLGSLALTGAISEEFPGALWRLLNSPLQVAISSVRNLIFSPPTITSCSFSGSWVPSRGVGGRCKDCCSPSASVNSRTGKGGRWCSWKITETLCKHTYLTKQCESRFSSLMNVNRPSHNTRNSFKTMKANPRGGGGEYSLEILVGGCGPPLEILTLFQTKICDFPYPISDLTHNSIPYFRPDINLLHWVKHFRTSLNFRR